MNWPVEDLWLQLQALLPGLSVEVLPSVPSTNTLLMERVRSAADLQPCLLVAEQQTQGRGRLGRAWHSEAGASLTFSLALPLAPADWSGLSLAVGLALADALDAPGAGQPRIGLKWPNDLWLLDAPGEQPMPMRGRKLGGILIETVNAPPQAGLAAGTRVVVIGIGLNVLPLPAGDAAQPLSQGHGSLSELDAAASAPRTLLAVAAPLLQALQRFEREAYAPLQAGYARRDVLRGQAVTTTLADSPEGRCEGVDAQGALLLRLPGGALQRVHSGEVSVRLQAGAAAQEVA